MIRGEQMIDKSQILEVSEDLDDVPMVNGLCSIQARRGTPYRGRSHLRPAVEVVVVLLGHVGRRIVDEAN